MNYQVIARKYRPQTFSDVVGQRHVMTTLENAIRTNRVAHAYIFSGARGVGKTTTARILAKALNCVKGPTVQPCNECPACTEITAGTSLDVIEIDAASNRGIDQIRELREMVRFAPMGGGYKVVLLDEAHMLTDEASNALLKTLEEPPDKTIFIMATTQPEDLVDTIRSRSQHFHFRALSFSEISDAIRKITAEEKLTIESGALAVIARAAEGSLRDALSVLEQAIAYSGANITDAQVRELLGVVPEEVLDELVEAIRAQSAERGLALVHKLIAEGQNLQHFCRETIRHFRNVLVARVCGADSDLIAAPAEERGRLARAAAEFSEEDLTRYFEILLGIDRDLRHSPDPRLHMEMGILRMVNAARLAPLEELLAEIGGSTAPATSGGRSSAAGAAAASTPRMMAGAAPQSATNPPARKLESPAPGTPAQTAAVPPMQKAPSIVAQTAAKLDGLSSAQVQAIKDAIGVQSKFLSNLLEPVTRWVRDGDEIHLYFSSNHRSLTEMVPREQMEQLRAITSQVVGQPLRVCVRLESAASSGSGAMAARAPASALRAQIEQDPIVRAMLEKFGGQIRDVKDRKD